MQFRQCDIKVIKNWIIEFKKSAVSKTDMDAFSLRLKSLQKLLSHFPPKDNYFARKESRLNFYNARKNFTFLPAVLLVQGLPIGLFNHEQKEAGAIIAFSASDENTHFCYNRDAGTEFLALEMGVTDFQLPEAPSLAKQILVAHKGTNKAYGGKPRSLREQCEKLQQRRDRLEQDSYLTKNSKKKDNSLDRYYFGIKKTLPYNESLIAPAFFRVRLSSVSLNLSDISHLIISDDVCGGGTFGNLLLTFMMQIQLAKQKKYVGICYYHAQTGKHIPLPLELWCFFNRFTCRYLENKSLQAQDTILNLSHTPLFQAMTELYHTNTSEWNDEVMFNLILEKLEQSKNQQALLDFFNDQMRMEFDIAIKQLKKLLQQSQMTSAYLNLIENRVQDKNVSLNELIEANLVIGRYRKIIEPRQPKNVFDLSHGLLSSATLFLTAIGILIEVLANEESVFFSVFGLSLESFTGMSNKALMVTSATVAGIAAISGIGFFSARNTTTNHSSPDAGLTKDPPKVLKPG